MTVYRYKFHLYSTRVNMAILNQTQFIIESIRHNVLRQQKSYGMLHLVAYITRKLTKKEIELYYST